MSFDSSNKNTRKPETPRQYDIHVLLADPSPGRRAVGARKAAAEIERGDLDVRAAEAVREAVRLFANDTDLSVRLALVVALKTSRHLPRDVAVTLARDVFAIAQPILQNSPSLTDEDLVAVIGDEHGASQVAIARRPFVSESVAGAIIDARNAAAVTALAANSGAALDETLMHRIIDRYAGFETAKAALVERGELPATVCERLIPLVAPAFRPALSARQLAAEIEPFPANEHEDVVGGSDTEVAASTVVRLHAQGELTPTAVLRALCMGEIRFVEDAMAELAGLSAEKACLLIHDDGPFGLKAIYRKCAFPEQLFPAFRVAFDLAQELEIDRQASDPERFEQTVVERILTRYRELEADDLDYVLSRLNRHKAA